MDSDLNGSLKYKNMEPYISNMDETVLVEDRSGSNAKKLSVPKATALITGEMIGAAVLALPFAIVTSGVYGLLAVFGIGFLSAYGGMKLGRCWQIVLERWPEYDTHVHDPFATLGYLCFGKIGREFTRVHVLFMLFASDIVVLLLAGEMINDLTARTHISYCYWIMILGAAIVAPLWLGTPKDFWQAGVIATSATFIGLTIIVWHIVAPGDIKIDKKEPEITFWSVALSFSTISFMYSCSATFPTIQNDMKDKTKFPMAVLFSYIAIVIIYGSLAIISFVLLGKNTTPNVVQILPQGPWKICIEVLLAIHLFMAFFIIANPVLQEYESWLKVPLKFGWKRVLARTSYMIVTVFIAATVPKFNYLLNVIGSCSVSFLSFIFPAVFYLKLAFMKSPENMVWPKWHVPKYEIVLLGITIVFGSIVAVASTYVSVLEMVSKDSFAVPCYLKSVYNHSSTH